ncbi:MAG: PSD1 and planctomycete cytochrome C domain-containing protein [Acidobacteriota bacterium]
MILGSPGMKRLVLALAAAHLPFHSVPAAEKAALPTPIAVKVDFKRDIEPIFSQNCIQCHGPALQMNSLRLDQRQSALSGGVSGPAIQPGNSAASRLILMVAGHVPDKLMPPEGDKLSPSQIGLLRAWIDQGAHWPNEATSGRVEKLPAEKMPWSFAKLKRPKVPRKRNSWIRNPVDNFVWARLRKEKVKPSPETDRVTLIRRVSLDLTGLLPTPQEVADFVADSRKDAYERLVDRLLDSPHYGEKWARQWLDLARYADSDGYEKDNSRPYAWRYRQWVIDALNQNMPFDQFTIQQIAGDLLPDATVEHKIATGFHRNTLTNREGGIDLEEFRMEQVLDRAVTTGTVWLGLTVGCARCHDHKYDPISQREFYQLVACFNSAKEVNIEAPRLGEIGPYLSGKPERDKQRRALLNEYRIAELFPEWERKVLEAADHPGIDVPYDIAWDTLGKMVDHGHEILRKPVDQRTQKEQDKIIDFFVRWYSLVVSKERYEELKYNELRQKLTALDEQYPGLTEAQTMMENPVPRETHILVRGDFRQPGIEVQPGALAALPPFPPGPEAARLRLARWLVSKENPLTARVMVNRIWQEFFGRGLVGSSGDFGVRGDLPTHPQLLDWLAVEFRDRGWQVKGLHRLIVTSATYRQSSSARKDLESRDPYNKLLARQNRLRLAAELVRDCTLQASGLLDPTVGGESIRPPLPPGITDLSFGSGVSWKESEGPARYRRGLYIHFQRSIPYPQLTNFDEPDSLLSCSRRERSTTPLQALNLLNDPVFFESAQGLATRVLRENRGSLEERLDYAFRLCFGRASRPDELQRTISFYRQQRELLGKHPEAATQLYPAHGIEGVDPSEAAAWVSVSRVLLNLDEFITRG